MGGIFRSLSPYVIGSGFHGPPLTGFARRRAIVPVLEYNFNGQGFTTLAQASTLGPVPAFARASDDTGFDENGVLQTRASNIPVFSHDPLTGISHGLQVPAPATNACLQSEDFDTTWTKVAVTVLTNTVVAPDGNTTMDNILETATTAIHEAQSNIHAKAASAQSWTATVFAKADLNRDFLYLIIDDGGDIDRTVVEFNISTGAISIAVVNTGTFANGVASIQDVGGGIYRCRVSATTNADAVVRMRSRIRASSGISNYLGDVTKGMSFWGAQLELGAFPTPYIKTTTAAAARAATLPTIALAGVPGFADEGMILIDYNFPILTGLSSMLMQIDDGTGDNRIYIEKLADETIRATIRASASTSAQFTSTETFSAGIGGKVALTWKNNNANISFKGELGTRDTGVTIPTGLTTMRIGNNHAGLLQPDGNATRLAYWNRHQPDSELQARTA